MNIMTRVLLPVQGHQHVISTLAKLVYFARLFWPRKISSPRGQIETTTNTDRDIAEEFVPNLANLFQSLVILVREYF